MILSLKSAPGWLDILICPQCRGTLRLSSNTAVQCPRCKRPFPLRNNIPLMVPVSEDASRRQLAGKERSELEPWFERKEELDACRRGKRDEAWCARQFIDADEFTRPNGTFLVEIGPGPMPRLAWFDAEIRVGIDALADEYDDAFASSRDYPINFLAAHTEALPLADGSVDALFCINALDHVGNMSIALSEIWRILKPNGLFFLGVLSDSSPLLCEEPHVVDQEFLEKELRPNFQIEREALDTISNDEPPLGWYRARLRKSGRSDYLHRFTPAQYAEIGEFFRHFTEGMFFDYQGRFAEARTAFQRALRYPGHYAGDRLRLEYCAWRATENAAHARAQSLFDVVERSRERLFQFALLEAAYKMGSTHKRHGQPEKSLTLFADLLKVAEPLGFKRLCGGAHFHMGEIHLQQGDTASAEDRFRKALAFIPDHKKAKMFLEGLSGSSRQS